MRSLRAAVLPALLLSASAPLPAQGPALAEVQERRLSNGLRVLVVERAGGGAVHARLFVRTPGAAPALAQLSAETLFGVSAPEDAVSEAPALEALLAREEGLREELRMVALRAGRVPEPGPAGLADLHQAAYTELEARLPGLRGADALDKLGASRREAAAETDHLAYGLDLPAAALPAWAAHETARMKALRLAQLPIQRAVAVRAATTEGPDAAWAAFLAVAYPGHPYGRTRRGTAAELDAVGLAEARAFLRHALAPEAMALVLVGDVTAEAAVPVLERPFGTLPADGGLAASEAPPPAEANGARRVQATLPGASRLLMGWRLPPRSHADHLGLRVLARLLAGGPGSRLRWGPLEPRGILAGLGVSFGVPGARDGGLLVFEATPGEGHSLAEVEQAITAEILRVQQDPLPDEEILGAQRRVMLEGLETQEDAAAFAAALGEAWSQAGRWQMGLTDPVRVKTWGSEELRRLARSWLSLDRAVTVLAEPDPLTAEEDPLDGRLIEALRTMARKRMDDPAAVDALVRSSIRQLRMLPRVERERVLELLRAEGRS